MFKMGLFPLISVFFVIAKLGVCEVTDKEYALLPSVFEWDHYENCMLLQDEALYCHVEYHLQPIDPKNPSPSWNQIAELSADIKNFRHDILRHSVCVPLTCPNTTGDPKSVEFKEGINECFNHRFKKYGLYGSVKDISCQTTESPPFDLYDKFVIVLCTTYLVLVIWASFYEGLARYKTPEEYKKITGTTYGKFMSCFSLPRNWLRLTTVGDSKDIEAFRGIQGIRFYNTTIVILCHSCLLASYGPVMNTRWGESLFDKFATVFMASGPFAVETAFILSAWFLSYHIFSEFNENSKKEFSLKYIFQILLHRSIRVIPPLAFIIMFNSTLLYHIERGPMWDVMIGREKEYCRENGWLNLVFLNNQINYRRMCFIESWYTATDMHGFILALVILYFSVKKPKRLFWIIPSLILIWQAVISYRIYSWNVTSLPRPHPEDLYMYNLIYKDNLWINFTGGTFWNLIGTLFGILGGYTYYKYKNTVFFTKTIHHVIWWFITLVLGFATVICPGLWLYSKNFYPTPWFTYPYFALITTFFGISVSSLLFGFTQGLGWMAKWVCEWRPTYVLGRLTYAIFLAHYPFMLMRRGSMKSLPYIDDSGIYYCTFETIVVSIMGGVIINLLIELPVSALQGEFMMKKRKNKEEDRKVK